MPRNKINQLNWRSETRSALIEFRVVWRDWINRADLMDALDTDPEARRPQDQQIVMLNKELSDRLDRNPSSREGKPNTLACN